MLKRHIIFKLSDSDQSNDFEKFLADSSDQTEHIDTKSYFYKSTNGYLSLSISLADTKNNELTSFASTNYSNPNIFFWNSVDVTKTDFSKLHNTLSFSSEFVGKVTQKSIRSYNVLFPEVDGNGKYMCIFVFNIKGLEGTFYECFYNTCRDIEELYIEKMVDIILSQLRVDKCTLIQSPLVNVFREDELKRLEHIRQYESNITFGKLIN